MSFPACPNTTCRGRVPYVVRHGFFRARCGRRRRYRCRHCGHMFSNRTNTAVARLWCSSLVFERVAHLSVEGISRSAIARVEGITWHTADRWLAKAAALARRFNENHLHGFSLVKLQADELRTFAPSKAKPLWVFTTMEVYSRLWPSTIVGRRSYTGTSSIRC